MLDQRRARHPAVHERNPDKDQLTQFSPSLFPPETGLDHQDPSPVLWPELRHFLQDQEGELHRVPGRVPALLHPDELDQEFNQVHELQQD